ncbi:hypothetical protein GWI33_000123 [Rhynchophorus ferrugineus]|uniref:PiggyBac transposable element-derived protein domain-containing protein n=1 Tax=Rhynchophorus ferrugineus TaxID=354439 RepID=A0A834IVL7_RHYFE|nr:hypothetical protein GWI33_000123 [Rhynchophorus ferrugineus]
MSRNRFDEINRYIHLSGNDKLAKSDKFPKLRPFSNELNKQVMQFGVFPHNISIDEEMVPYFGHHSAKRFIRGKPVWFEFKLWCIASAYMSDTYGGASQTTIENVTIFFDNFFTSHYLHTLLSEMKFFGADTMREN